MRNLKKKWKRALTLLVAIALIVVDLPISNAVKVSANNSSYIDSISYSDDNEGSEIQFDKASDANNYEKYINATTDTISVQITLNEEVNIIDVSSVTVLTSESVSAESITVDNNIISCTIAKDALYTISADGTEMGTIKWIQDNTKPEITIITDSNGAQYASNEVVLVADSVVRIYVEDANRKLLKIDDTDESTETVEVTEIKEEEIDSTTYYYYEYEVSKSDTYTFVAVDKANNSSDAVSMSFEVDDKGPTIIKVVNADSAEGSEIIYSEWKDGSQITNYVDGDSVNLKIYVSDEKSDVTSISYNGNTITDIENGAFECTVTVGDIEFTLTDSLGNTAKYTYKFVTTTMPTIDRIYGKDVNNNDVELIVNSESANYVKDGDVVIYIDATKGNSSDIAGIRYSKENDFNTANVITENNESKYLVTLTDIAETDTYYFWAFDEAGNVSDVKTVKFTKDATTIEIGNVSITETNRKYKLEVSFITGLSGIKSVTVKCGNTAKDIVKDGDKYYISNLTYEELSKTFEFTIIKNTIDASSHICEYSNKNGLEIDSSSKLWINKSDINNSELNNIKFTLKTDAQKVKSVNAISYQIKSDNGTLENTIGISDNSTYTIDFGDIVKDKNWLDDNYRVIIKVNYTYYNWRGKEISNDLMHEIYVNVDREDPSFTLNTDDYVSNYINVNDVADLKITGVADTTSGIAESGIKVELCDENSNVLSDISSSLNNNTVTLSEAISTYMENNNVTKATYVVKVTVSDVAGNKASNSVTVMIDNTGMTFESNIDDYKGWVNLQNKQSTTLKVFNIGTREGAQVGDVTVTIKEGNSEGYTVNMTENTSEAGTYYEFDLATLLTGDLPIVLENGKEYEISICVKESEDSYDVNKKYTYETVTITMGLDNENPEITQADFIDYDGDWTRYDVQVDITAGDDCTEEEALNYYYYVSKTITDITGMNLSEIGDEYEGIIYAPSNAVESGEYNVFFWVEDAAGNISDVVDKKIKFDVSNPSVDVTIKNKKSTEINNVKWYTEDVVIGYLLKNQYSNLDIGKSEGNVNLGTKHSTGVAFNEADILEENGYKLEKDITVKAEKDGSKDGIWNGSFKISNKAGGSATNEFTFAIDTQAPVLENGKVNITKNKYISDEYIDKNPVTISGKVTDNIITGVAGSGVAKIELVDGSGKTVKSVNNVNEYSFILNKPETYTGYMIKVTDKVGHVTLSNPFNILITDADTNITPVYEAGYVSVGSQKWYSKNTPISFNVVNKNKAGLSSVTIHINEKEVYKQTNISKNKKETSLSCKVNTKDATVNSEDNSYDIKVTAIDNAGNKTVETYTIYKDTKKPDILEFRFGDEKGVVKADYGYFFIKDTKVTVMASDQANASGLDSISFYTISKDGKKSAVTTKTTNSTATFTVPAGFKGQIYAYATDKVGNESSTENRRLAGTVIETEAKHKETSKITFDIASTTYEDNNGNPLYKGDVHVTINVEDTFSGIKSVSWKVLSNDETGEAIEGSVGIDEVGEITGDTDNLTKNKNDKNLVTALTKKLVVNHNSNNIRVRVTLEDNAGHKSTKTLVFSIDKTAPEVNVTYNNIIPDNNNIFNANRVATITVTERNFNSKDINLDITNTDGEIPQITLWDEVEGTGNGDDTVHRAAVTFSEDGDYTFAVGFADRATNEATINYGNAVAPNEFTIDKTNPVMTIVYDNNAASNGNYYQDNRTATLSINEHNFDAGRVEVTISENGENSNKTISNWTTNGDNHTATVTFNTEAEYRITAACQDMAGNELQNAINEVFTIDTTEPTMLITGVEDSVAYNSDTVGVTVTAGDTYFDSLDVVLLKLDSKGNSEQIVLNGVDIANGKEYSITNLTDDAVYMLQSTAKDKSGKTVTDSRTFSVNRNGSTFAITDEYAVAMKNAYVNEANDIVIYETNVNKLDMASISVMIYKNGEAIELVLDEGYKIVAEEKDGQWCKYTYTIFKENFVDDATYRVAIYSEDEAKNVALSESSDKGAELSFVVDTTKPICNVYDLKSNTTYGVDSKTVEFMPEDNIELSSIVVLLNGKESMNVSGEELKNMLATGENLSFVIASSTSSQNVVIKCTDMAGNESEIEIRGFYVTTDLWVQFTTNTPLVIVSIVAIVLVLALIIFLVVKKKKSKNFN